MLPFLAKSGNAVASGRSDIIVGFVHSECTAIFERMAVRVRKNVVTLSNAAESPVATPSTQGSPAGVRTKILLGQCCKHIGNEAGRANSDLQIHFLYYLHIHILQNELLQSKDYNAIY